jgi:hypothetical protein
VAVTEGDPTPLETIWLLDQSGSMVPDGNIQSVNAFMSEVEPHFRRLAGGTTSNRLVTRVVAFDSEPRWLIDRSIEFVHLDWEPISGNRRQLSEFGRALAQVHTTLVESLHSPLLVCVSDGWWTDTAAPSWRQALEALERDTRTRNWTRLAVPIGREPEISNLERFVGASGALVDSATPQHVAELASDAWRLCT